MSCRETDEAEEESDREEGRSPSEQTVFTEVQEDEALRSPDDIILPRTPLREDTDRGRLSAGTQAQTSATAEWKSTWLPPVTPHTALFQRHRQPVLPNMLTLTGKC